MKGFPDNPILGGLMGCAPVAAHLDGPAEIAAMVAFEVALARAQAAHGVIPAPSADAIAAALGAGPVVQPSDLIDPTRSAGVPVPGLVKLLRAHVGEPHGSFVHWGATSQDVIDTGWVLRLRECLDLMQAWLSDLVDVLGEQALAHADQPMAGRTRSQVATPVTFGLRVASWRAPLARCLDRLADLRPRVLMLQLGGAAGTLSVLGAQGPAVAETMARDLRLECPTKPWHAERDGIVELANWLSMVSGLLGRIGGDLILMGRSEAGEAFAGTGGGSSTMPQKSNPVLAESLVTLARFNAAQAGLAQQALMHHEERDGTAWSGEWLALPPMLTATGAGLVNALDLARTLRAVPDRMADVMQIGGGAIHAEGLAFALAGQMALGEAQALVKEAAQTMGPEGLIARVAALCAMRGIDMPPTGDDALALAAQMVRRAVGKS